MRAGRTSRDGWLQGQGELQLNVNEERDKDHPNVFYFTYIT